MLHSSLRCSWNLLFIINLVFIIISLWFIFSNLLFTFLFLLFWEHFAACEGQHWLVGRRSQVVGIYYPPPASHLYMYLHTLCHILQYINHTFLMYLHTVPYITYMYLHTVPYIYHTFTYTLHCHILQYIIQLYTYTLHYHALQYTYFHPIPLPIHPLLAPRCYIHLKWRLRRKLFWNCSHTRGGGVVFSIPKLTTI